MKNWNVVNITASIAWIIAALVSANAGLAAITAALNSQMNSASGFAMGAAFATVALFALWQALRQKLRAPSPAQATPLWPAPAADAALHPAPPMRTLSVDEALAALQAAGVLRPHEIDAGELAAVLAGEGVSDDGSADSYDIAHALAALAERRTTPLSRVAVFHDQVEMDETALSAIVHAFARLSVAEVAQLQFRFGTGKPRAAHVSFTSAGRRCDLDFTFHAKNLPGDFFGPLARFFQQADHGPPFALGGFDNLVLLTRMTDEQLETLNATLDPGMTWFEPLAPGA
ncbi:MAG: hypothetical protein A4S14_02165 [Proteobacteria bacterium SG_bin9]|nr:MAG: hypothetical protein A4S14_02165 [Proteobacteria bacterium SG_bin9]